LPDEIDQINAVLANGEHLKNREQNRQEYRNKLKKLRTVAPSATSNQDDLDLNEALSGRRYSLINFVPNHGFQKGTIEVHHGDPNIKGSGAAARNTVIERIPEGLGRGERVLVAVDEVSSALDIAEMAKEEWGLTDSEILVNTAETRETDIRVSQFIESPDSGAWLHHHPKIRLVIYNSVIPSGKSIVDPKGVQLFGCVVGVFKGATIAPALVLQMIYRYRSDVPKFISLPNKGRYSPLTGSNHKHAKGFGHARKVHAKRLNRQERERLIGLTTRKGFDFDQSEFEDYADRLELRLEREYRNFAVAAIAYLERDGFTVNVNCHRDRQKLKTLKERVRLIKAQLVVDARSISESEYANLKGQPELSKLALAQINAYEVRKFYGISPDDDLPADLVLKEGFGRGRKALENLLRQTLEGKALADDFANAERLGPQCSSRDMSAHHARVMFWEELRIPEILAYCLTNRYNSESESLREWWDNTIVPKKEKLLAHPGLMGFRLSGTKQKPIEKGNYTHLTRMIGILLKKLGFETESTQHRSGEGDKRIRTYQVTQESIEFVRGKLLETLENGEFLPRHTPLSKVLLGGCVTPSFHTVNQRYLEALEREDLVLAERLAAQLDKFQGVTYVAS
jgi:hypothetical protein